MHEQGHAAQGKELGRHGNDDPICCSQRVDGQQTKRRLAVDDDDVILLSQGPDGSRQCLLPTYLRDQLNLGSRQINVGRDNVKAVKTGVPDHLVYIQGGIEHGGVNGVIHAVGVDAQTHSSRALGIKVHDQDPSPIQA